MKTISCMNIDKEFLYSFGGEDKNYKKGEMIFREGDHAFYYFQITEGKVKLNNYNEEGKEFIQNILGEKQSFGDSLLFLDRHYPMNAVTITPCSIIRLAKNDFLKLLKKYPDLSLQMNGCLSQRLYYKMLMIQNMASQDPASRLKGVLDYLKSFHENSCQYDFHIQLTRQQLANLTGLRVETVIRTLKKMEKTNLLKIENKKILY